MRAELENLPEVTGPGGVIRHGEQVLALLDRYRPAVCVELGTWFGGSAIPVARLIRQWGGHLTCVDLWASEPVVYNRETILNTMSRCRQNFEDAGVGEVVDLVQSSTADAARKWDRGLIDYLYVDADHSYQECKSDLELWWYHLRVGGIIAGDDYNDPRYGVTRAWDEFEVEHSQTFVRVKTPGIDSCLIWGVKR
jgi:predicted O-methyltransferase YrrM